MPSYSGLRGTAWSARLGDCPRAAGQGKVLNDARPWGGGRVDTIAGILQVLLAVVFVFAGGSKVAGIRMPVDNFNRYGYPQWFRVFTGLVELAGAAGMVVGLFAEEAAIAAGIVLGAVMVGAAYTDLRKSTPVSVVAPVLLFGLCAAVVILRVAE